MTDFIDADGFRANVGIVLIRDDRQVFLGGRTGGRGWQFPQGGVRRNEATRGGAVSRAQGRDRSRAQGCRAGRRDPWLAALPACLGNTSVATAIRSVSARNSAGFCCASSVPRRVCASTRRRSRSSKAGGGSTTGRPCARSSTSSAPSTRGRWMSWRSAPFPIDPPALPEWSDQEKNLRNLARRRAEAATNQDSEVSGES